MQALIALAKSRGPVLVVVGHVTKDGQIAGPKVIEHMVDTVLTFEGESHHNLRLLRATKNRFGPANEIGVFDMHGDGLREVANPSQLFMTQDGQGTAGSAIFAGIEGTRPILVEIQALLAPSPYAAPRRSVVGWDQNRLAMILCGARSPLRRKARRARRLSQRGRRIAHRRARRRPGRCGGTPFRAHGHCAST